MAITQAALQQMAQRGMALFGDTVDTVTFYAKSSAGAAPVTHAGIVVHREEFSLRELAAAGGEILSTDCKCRIPAYVVIWQPTPFDELVLANGTRWRVRQTMGGTQTVWAILPIFQVA